MLNNGCMVHLRRCITRTTGCEDTVQTMISKEIKDNEVQEMIVLNVVHNTSVSYVLSHQHPLFPVPKGIVFGVFTPLLHKPLCYRSRLKQTVLTRTQRSIRPSTILTCNHPPPAFHWCFQTFITGISQSHAILVHVLLRVNKAIVQLGSLAAFSRFLSWKMTENTFIVMHHLSAQ